jgi:hypothetical protein
MVVDFFSLIFPGFCLIAITLEDLYPSDYHDYTFGEADHKNMVGVFSFSRFVPRGPAWTISVDDDFELCEAEKMLLTRRACQVRKIIFVTTLDVSS